MVKLPPIGWSEGPYIGHNRDNFLLHGTESLNRTAAIAHMAIVCIKSPCIVCLLLNLVAHPIVACATFLLCKKPYWYIVLKHIAKYCDRTATSHGIPSPCL